MAATTLYRFMSCTVTCYEDVMNVYHLRVYPVGLVLPGLAFNVFTTNASEVCLS